MKKLFVVLGLVFAASPAFAQKDHSDATGTAVHWHDIVGVITAQGVDNPVSSNISSGTFAWSTSAGNATVDLASGDTSFSVAGLVINGTQFSGTPGPVTAVTGTLVCNPGTAFEVPSDTAAVPLSATGDAKFAGTIGVPANCANPLFLVRIAVPAGAAGRWIATGTERTGAGTN